MYLSAKVHKGEKLNTKVAKCVPNAGESIGFVKGVKNH